MATPITYKKLDDGSWGAWIPAHFGDVVVGETIHVMKRSGQKNAHAVQAIITTYKSGTVVRIMDVVEAAPSEITTAVSIHAPVWGATTMLCSCANN